jgi:hypothetical protein
MLFNRSGKGIDENLDVTTLRSTYLGCNACFVCFDLEPKSFNSKKSFFPWKEKKIQTFTIYNDFLGVKYDLHL